tara:strand:- start:1214 stop:1573 length:360 start_codon:yes stop_codon:yes gene_type:complete
MLYFGSRNFGQANFGKGLITTAVDETLTTSTMQVAGYRLIEDCGIDPSAVVNVDIAAGIVRLANVNITPEATMIASKILMTWSPRTNLGVGTATVQASGYIAWDSQLTDDATWTNQTVS